MIIGIDAVSISSGGGLTYLMEFVNNLDADLVGDGHVFLWLNAKAYDEIDERYFVTKVIVKNDIFSKTLWKTTRLSAEARNKKCNIIFVMDSIYFNFRAFENVVTINQNLLPLEFRELLRYGISMITLKFIFLRWIFIYTFNRSKGVVFLSEYAKNKVLKVTNNKFRRMVIHHASMQNDFSNKRQLSISKYNYSNPYNIVYVSSVEPYKHHIRIIEAVSSLREKGLPVSFRIVGNSGNSRSINLLEKAIRLFDPTRDWIVYDDDIEYKDMSLVYNEMNLMIFSSTCETFGIPISEAINAYVPIVCSNRSSMSSIFGDKLFYFDPFSKESIADVLLNVIKSPNLRKIQTKRNYESMKYYGWGRVSLDTYSFIDSCVGE
jgi:glycosyltransferase involved in cell wall biosynthesis